MVAIALTSHRNVLQVDGAVDLFSSLLQDNTAQRALKPEVTIGFLGFTVSFSYPFLHIGWTMCISSVHLVRIAGCHCMEAF
jgi:hypothetical protein